MIGKYRLLAELGHGGMAQVYLALSKGVAGFNKLVVVKVIHTDLAEDPDFVRMFLEEARLAARLNHPNVVQTNEVDHDGKRYFIAMEYLEGQTLNRIFNRMGRDPKLLPLGHRLRLVADALAGLHYAHELCDFDGTALEVVHRDITPHNIFVSYSGQVKVVDFGIAKALNSNVQTQSGVLKGKVSYMAPEQARGERVDRRADIFSVGMILWQVATGKRLYRDMTELAVIQKICNGEVPKVSEIAPFVPPRLQAIIDRALAPHRDERYATAVELQTDIEAYLDATNAKASSREIGALVADHFAEERAEIKAIIEDQLRQEVQEASIHALPKLEPSTGSGTSTRQDGSGSGSIRTGVETGSAVAVPAASGDRSNSVTSVTYTGPTQHAVRRTRKNRVIGMAAGAGVLLAVAVAGIAFWPKGATTAAGATPSATGSAPARTPTLRIDSKPTGAMVSEGGKALGSTPLNVSFEADMTGDRVFIVQAPGHKPYEVRQGRLSNDLTIVAPLEVEPGAASSATSAASVAAAAGGRGVRPKGTGGTGDKPKATAAPAATDTLDIRTNR
jgi:eukaryotic-like serine/threonine-protein kinase